ALVPDWDVGYAYDRWRPTLFAAASSSTLFAAGPADAKGRPSSATLRERALEAGIFVPFRHVRSSHRALFSLVRTADQYSSSSGTVPTNRSASLVGFATNTSRLYGYLISPEHGFILGVTGEVT